MYLFDEGEVRRVTDVVWSTTSRPARYQAVIAFVDMLDADNGGDHEDVNYIINAELHHCIRGARDIQDKSYNSEVHFVFESP